MQATLQATPKNKETLQETSADEIAVIASKFGQLRTSENVEIVDGMLRVIPMKPKRTPIIIDTEINVETGDD